PERVRTAVVRVDLGRASYRPGKLGRVVDDPSGAAVLDDLGDRPPPEADHGGAAGEGLDRGQPERLPPLGRDEQAAGSREQLQLALAVDLTQPADVVRE